MNFKFFPSAILAVLMVGMFAFTGCNKDDDDNGSPSNSNNNNNNNNSNNNPQNTFTANFPDSVNLDMNGKATFKDFESVKLFENIVDGYKKEEDSGVKLKLKDEEGKGKIQIFILQDDYNKGIKDTTYKCLSGSSGMQSGARISVLPNGKSGYKSGSGTGKIKINKVTGDKISGSFQNVTVFKTEASGFKTTSLKGEFTAAKE